MAENATINLPPQAQKRRWTMQTEQLWTRNDKGEWISGNGRWAVGRWSSRKWALRERLEDGTYQLFGCWEHNWVWSRFHPDNYVPFASAREAMDGADDEEWELGCAAASNKDEWESDDEEEDDDDEASTEVESRHEARQGGDIQVKSSSRPDVIYTIRQTAKELVCDCPGFRFRKTCKHVTETQGGDAEAEETVMGTGEPLARAAREKYTDTGMR